MTADDPMLTFEILSLQPVISIKTNFMIQVHLHHFGEKHTD